MNKHAQIIDSLRQKGCRLTPQRLLIISVVEAGSGHMGVDDIYQKAKESYPYIDIATVYIQPAFHEKDTTHIIEFSLNNPIFVYRNYDPSGDNYSGYDTTGTEGNENYDEGELFEDCGPDHLCNVDESGFNSNGTEKNDQYDSTHYPSDFIYLYYLFY